MYGVEFVEKSLSIIIGLREISPADPPNKAVLRWSIQELVRPSLLQSFALRLVLHVGTRGVVFSVHLPLTLDSRILLLGTMCHDGLLAGRRRQLVDPASTAPHWLVCVSYCLLRALFLRLLIEFHDLRPGLCLGGRACRQCVILLNAVRLGHHLPLGEGRCGT